MIYKGKFYFDKKEHPGECEVDEENHIYLTINESDINSFKKKIVGNAGNESLILYSCRLVEFGVGYYKYQVSYMIKNCVNIKYRNVDFNKHIQEFRFTFEPLDEWLEFKTIERNKEIIKFNIPDDIILYDTDELRIKIKFFEEDSGLYDNSIRNIKVLPYICVSSSKIIAIKKIMTYIQLITRFFAILMGYSGKVNRILFPKMYNGKIFMEKLEDELVINTNFTNKYDIRVGYPTYNLRTYFKDLSDDIKEIYSRWFELYFNKKYGEAITVYFSPYNAPTVESNLLNITKCLEKINIADENKNEKQNKNKSFHKILIKFYKQHKKELEKELKENNFKKEYIKNIENIHENIANAIVYKYDNRITLSKRLKDIDQNFILNKNFNPKHCTKTNNDYSIYDYLANTRNYYTHLDKGEYIIKDKYIPGYCRKLEKLFISKLLNLIIKDKKYVDEKIQKDIYLRLYDDRDL